MSFRAFSLLCLAQFGGETLVDPRDFLSPSGAFVLHVEPSARDGAGPGEYRMARDGERVWSAELAFTLFEAAVTDSGATVGYAYDGGVQIPRGRFHEVVIAPDGRMLLDVQTERRPCRYVVCPPPAEPRALGLVVDQANDRCVVRIQDDDWEREMELWRAYRISTGEKLAEFRPEESLSREGHKTPIWDVRALPGSDLFLVHRVTWRHEPRQSGASFALIDLQGKVVWTLDLPHDYEIAGDSDAQFAFNRSVRNRGAIVATPAPCTFDLWFVRDAQRVRFQAAPDPGSELGWTVSELARRPWNPEGTSTEEDPEGSATDQADTGSMLERVQLELLATVALERSTKPPAAIRDVRAWAFGEEGRFEIIRGDATCYSFVALDDEGRVLREVPIRGLAEELAVLSWARVGPGTWMVSTNSYGQEKDRAFRVDTRTGELHELEALGGDQEGVLAPTTDGIIHVLGTYPDEGAYALAGFDPSGALRWSVPKDYGSEEARESFGCDGFAITSDGRVVALGEGGKTLQEFTSQGQYLRTIDLEQAFGREPNYLSGISPGPNGSVLVYDFDADPPLWQLDAKGSLVDTFDPRFPDGRPARAWWTHFSPDGVLWTCDGFSFLELDENGIVRRVVGEALALDEIFEIGAHAIDDLGRPCMQDLRTGTIHVWEPSGRKLFAGALDPAECEDLSLIARIVADPAGGLYVERGFRQSWLHWSPIGEFLGEDDLGSGAVVIDRHGRRWSCGFRGGLKLVDESGTVLATVERRPDGSWIRNVEDVALAGDGTLAVLDPPSVLLYSASGEPLRALEISPAVEKVLQGPPNEISFSGRWIALRRWGPETLLLRPEDGTSLLFEPDLPERDLNSWYARLSPDGTELWLFSAPELALRRYALP